MKRHARMIKSWYLVRLLLISGFCILSISLMIFPSTSGYALESNTPLTSQLSSANVPTNIPTQTPKPDVVSQVGANAGLVCGAVILVIIIIAGLIRSARWMPYRGHDDEPEGE